MGSLLDELRTVDNLEAALKAVVIAFNAESGTIHFLESDGNLHLRAASAGMPEPVLNLIRIIPVGKGMAGLAALRREPVTICNLQTDSSGDVRPGAKATGMEGAIVVPILDEENVVGTLGIANRSERTFTPDEQTLLLKCGQALVRHHRPQRQ